MEQQTTTNVFLDFKSTSLRQVWEYQLCAQCVGGRGCGGGGGGGGGGRTQEVNPPTSYAEQKPQHIKIHHTKGSWSMLYV